MSPSGWKRPRVIVLAMVVLMGCLAFVVGHEFSVRYYQDKTCTVCHEMKDPIRRWQQSGAATNHGNCAGCHFDTGIAGWLQMSTSAVRFLIAHFQRDPAEPIKPKPEPLILDERKEPGYWTRVPNHRCFQCHKAKNHGRGDQERIHAKVVRDVLSKPCIDCHSHEMRNGQKFYEKILAEPTAGPAPVAPEGMAR